MFDVIVGKKETYMYGSNVTELHYGASYGQRRCYQNFIKYEQRELIFIKMELVKVCAIHCSNRDMIFAALYKTPNVQ